MLAAASLIQDFVLTDSITMAATMATLVSLGFSFGIDFGEDTALADRLGLDLLVGLDIVMAHYLRKRWLAGGKLPISFSH